MTRTRTRKQLNASLVLWLAVSVGLSAQAEAHSGGRLFPIPELTDEMRARIDLKDGKVADWSYVLGEPTLTALDFSTDPRFFGYDPSSYDFRVWLAWHDATENLFVAAEFVDDVHVSTNDRYNTFF